MEMFDKGWMKALRTCPQDKRLAVTLGSYYVLRPLDNLTQGLMDLWGWVGAPRK